MSLATRCTSCGTVFRVVQDQLKVSDGWVRCGRCDAVFNAAEGLFDVDRESPPSWSPTQPPAETLDAAFTPSAAEAFEVDDRQPPRAAQDLSLAEARAAFGESEALRSPFPGTRGLQPPDFDAPDGTVDPGPASPPPDPGTAPEFAPSTQGEGSTSRRDIGWHPNPERDTRRRHQRAALAVAAVVLVLVLAAQAAAQFSETAAARWPGAKPLLARWCSVAGCSVAAPRRIQEIVVDSSALAPVTGTGALKLGIALRNRADFAVAIPSVDLSLTDSAGQLLARRTLHPADFHVAVPAVASRGEVALQALFTAGATPVTGYTVEIFYP